MQELNRLSHQRAGTTYSRQKRRIGGQGEVDARETIKKLESQREQCRYS
jgi:hypothetical protein